MLKKKYLSVIPVILLLALVLWTVWGNLTVCTTYYTITCDQLPDMFDGFRIAVVSDLHNASFGSENSRITQIIEKERPDMIAITGDLVDSNRTDIDTSVALIHRLMRIAPCYYVTGNHEARIGALFSELEERLLAENVQILHDQAVQLEKDGQTIQIIGLDDPAFTERDNAGEPGLLRSKLDRMDLRDEYSILLSHRPEAFEAYAAEGMDLVLSGHAHGGQFRLPFIGGVIAPNQGFFPKYDAGIYAQDKTTMVVSRGIGNSIIPVRFNNPPEIVIIELSCAE